MNPIGRIKHVQIVKVEIPKFSIYPFNTAIVRNIDGPLEIDPRITCITGSNATGKSTLLHAIAVYLGLNPEGGSKDLKFSTRRTHSELHKYLNIPRVLPLINEGFYFRADTFYNVATAIERTKSHHNYGGQSLQKLSHGQSIKALFMNRFRGNQLLLLDEPETGLDVDNLLEIRRRMEELADAGCQIIMVTHSPILGQLQDGIVYEFEHSYIRKVNFFESALFKKHRLALTGGHSPPNS
jgi:predicted ATPase